MPGIDPHELDLAAVTVAQVRIPPRSDPSGAWLYDGLTATSAASNRAIFGWDDFATTPGEWEAYSTDNEYRSRLYWVATTAAIPGADPTGQVAASPAVLGYASASLPWTANREVAHVGVEVHPAARGRGIGSLLLDTALEAVAAAGRTTVQTWSTERPEPEPGPGVLEPQTGSGRVRADSPAATMLLARGFTVEQVSRHSVLELPLDASAVSRLAAASAVAAGPGYRVLTWRGAIPAERYGQFAALETRMSTDAPSGGLDNEEDVWDADRVATSIAQKHAAGRASVISAVEHIRSGTLVAYTEIDYGLADAAFAFQETTIVLSAHRGRRLGMWLKAVNLAAFADERPDAVRIHTFNAQENAHMLAINVELGFRQASVEGLWQRRATAVLP